MYQKQNTLGHTNIKKETSETDDAKNQMKNITNDFFSSIKFYRFNDLIEEFSLLF